MEATSVQAVKESSASKAEETEETEKVAKEMSFDELLARHRADQAKAREEAATNGEQEKEEVREAVVGSRVRKVVRKSEGRKVAYFPLSSAAEVRSRGRVGEECLLIDRTNTRVRGEVGAAENGVKEEVKEGVTEGLTTSLASLSISKEVKVSPHLAFYTMDRAMVGVLEEEEAGAEEEVGASLAVWRGALGARVEAAAAEGRLTDRLVALSAGVSTVLWRRAARALGAQLVRAGEVVRGAEYLVGAGAVREGAVELSRGGHHRAALAVARSRLPPTDPLAAELLQAWARQSSGDGNCAVAARAWAAAGERARAAEQLGRLGDRASLRAAALLAGAEGRGPVYATQALTQALYCPDLPLVDSLVAEVPGLAWARPLATMHRRVQEVLAGAEVGEEGLVGEVRSRVGEVEEGWKEKMEAFVASSSHEEKEKVVVLQVRRWSHLTSPSRSAPSCATSSPPPNPNPPSVPRRAPSTSSSPTPTCSFGWCPPSCPGAPRPPPSAPPSSPRPSTGSATGPRSATSSTSSSPSSFSSVSFVLFLR